MEAKQESKSTRHDPVHAILVVFTVLAFAFVMFINFIGMSPMGKDMGLFVNGGNFSDDTRYLDISPAAWTFSIWGFIYAWQIIWMIYVVVNLFRKNNEGYALYANPATESPLFYISYVVNLGCNIGWLVLWDRNMIEWALILIALLPFTLYVCLVISHMRLYKNGNHMLNVGMCKDIWMIRLFIQNGLAFYATWVTIATLLNLGNVLAYSPLISLDQSIAGTICLSILAFELVLWFCLDIFAFDRYTRYQFSPYIVVILALIGSYAENYTAGARNSIFTIALLAAASLAGVLKVVMMVYRHCKRPIFIDNETPNDYTLSHVDTKA